MTDREFMELALELAAKSVAEPGKSSPNVAAVAVKNGELLESAFRGERKPGEHAEYTLLEGKLSTTDLSGATIYTTLEPCTTRRRGSCRVRYPLVSDSANSCTLPSLTLRAR